VGRLEMAWSDVQSWLLEGANAPLLLVLLLLLWLLLIVRRREEPAGVRPRRPEPVTLQELGRLAFQAARGRDERLWRDLFINGAEARALVGTRAEAFLETRPPVRLREALDLVSSQIPLDGTFDGLVTGADGVHAVRVESETRGPSMVGIGRSVQLGVIWRLVGGDMPLGTEG